MITRTFPEVTGKDLERRRELRAVMMPAERELYQVALKEFYRLEGEYFKAVNMSARKKAQARIIAQIKIMLRICTCAPVFRDYHGSPITGRMEAIFREIQKVPGKRVAIGVRQNNIVRAYAEALRQRFPNRPVFTITGSEYQPRQRRNLVHGKFEDFDNSILVCTQQSLPSSVNFEYVNKIIIPELHYNNSRMSQFYMRFIRYTSTEWKDIYFVTYAGSIESNQMQMVLAKEKINLFMKGQDVDLDEIYEKFGVDYDLLALLMYQEEDEEGHFKIRWGEQKIS